MGDIFGRSKFSIGDIYCNGTKIQKIISYYASHLVPNSVLSGFNNLLPVENSALPSYENIISEQDVVGTSNVNSISFIQQDVNFPETNRYSHERNTNNPSRD
jgi:hypothetical protein